MNSPTDRPGRDDAARPAVEAADHTNVARRQFLSWTAALGALATGALAGIPALRSFLSPLFRGKPSESWIEVGPVAALEAGRPVKVEFTLTIQDAWVERTVPKSVWVHSEDGETYTVFNGRCTHLGCSYPFHDEPDRFHPEGGVFHCPCHHAIYEVSGMVIRGPAPRPLDTLETKVEHGVLYAKYLDFRVGIPEKIPV